MLKALYIDETLYHHSSIPTLTTEYNIILTQDVHEISDDLIANIYSIKEIIYISDNLEKLLYAISNNICTIGFDTKCSLFNPLIKYIILDLSNLSSMYLNCILSHHNNEPASIYEDTELLIRELSIKDFDSVYNIFKSESLDNALYLNTYMTGDYSDEKEKFSEYIKNQYSFYGYGQYCVIRKSDNSIIGQCGFYEDDEGRICLSYYIVPLHRKCGIAYKTCRIIIDYLTEELDIKPIHAYINSSNKPSIKLILKLGFTQISKDCYIYDNK